MKSIVFRMRMEPEFKQQLQDAVKEGRADTMSDLIREAVQQFLTIGA